MTDLKINPKHEREVSPLGRVGMKEQLKKKGIFVCIGRKKIFLILTFVKNFTGIIFTAIFAMLLTDK